MRMMPATVNCALSLFGLIACTYPVEQHPAREMRPRNVGQVLETGSQDVRTLPSGAQVTIPPPLSQQEIQDRVKCQQYGFALGSPQFGQCLMGIDQQREANRAASDRQREANRAAIGAAILSSPTMNPNLPNLMPNPAPASPPPQPRPAQPRTTITNCFVAGQSLNCTSN